MFKLLLTSVLLAGSAAAQTPPITRTVLQKLEFPEDRYASELVRGVVAPRATAARHTHPGVEIGYIEAGEALVRIDGRSELRLAAGQSFAVPAGTPHSVQNLRPSPLTILSTYVVEKDKPLATPAP